MIILFVLLYVFVAKSKDELYRRRSISKNDGERPGVEFQVDQSTFNFVAGKLKPYVETQLKYIDIGTIISDQKIHVKTLGDFYVTLDGAYVQDGTFSSATLASYNSEYLSVTVKGVSCTGYVHWHYVGRGWPHITDSGSLDLTTLNVDMSLRIGVTIDSSEASNFKISVTDINLTWNTFDFVVHAGAGWLYTAILNNFKGDMENMVGSKIQDQIDPMIATLQTALNSVEFEIPIPGLKGIEIDYLPTNVNFAQYSKSLQKSIPTFGCHGYFMFDSNLPTGEAQLLPSNYGVSMVSIFITEYSFQSAIHAAALGGYLHTELEDNPKSPIRLNTNTFKYIVPDMYAAYPDELMDIDVDYVNGNEPHFTISSSGITVKGVFNFMFRILNGTKNSMDKKKGGSNHLINAFQITTEINFTIDASVKSQNPLTVTGKIEVHSFQMNLTYNAFQSFPVSSVGKILQTILQDILCPLINKVLEKGIPIPSIPDVQLKNPNVTLSDGWMNIGTDFDFIVPTTTTTKGN